MFTLCLLFCTIQLVKIIKNKGFSDTGLCILSPCSVHVWQRGEETPQRPDGQLSEARAASLQRDGAGI